MKKKPGILIKTLLTVNIIIVAIYLLSAFAGYLNPATFGYISLLAMGYPLMLGIVPATLIFWIFAHRQYLLITVGALLITIPQIATFFPFHFRDYDEEKTSDTFTLMTYNTLGMPITDKSDKSLGALEDVLEYNPDLVCFQECRLYQDLNKLGINDDLLARINARYPYSGSATKGICGFLSKRPVETIIEEESGAYYVVNVYKTQILGNNTYIINTHLESIGLTISDKELYMDLTNKDLESRSLRGVRSQLLGKLKTAAQRRSTQANRIHFIADSLKRAEPNSQLFICGDFNDPPYTYSYLTIKDEMGDAMKDAGTGYSKTYNENRFYFRIDHIFYDPDRFDAKCAFAAQTESSDHYPVVAVFKNKSNK